MTGDTYQNKQGWLHRLDPRSSLILSFLLVLQVFFLNRPVWVSFALVLIHLLLLTAGISLRTSFRLWKITLPLMLMIFVLWPLFNPSGGKVLWEWSFIRITGESLESGAVTALRLPVLLLASYIPLLTQRQNRLIRGWVGLGIPYRLGLVLLLALRFLPYFRESYQQIEQARQMRGMPVKGGGMKKHLPVMITLIVWALRTSENLSFALETRGLGLEQKPTSLVVLQFRFLDGVVLLIPCASAALLWFLR